MNILVTGDYSHQDFTDLLESIPAVTLVPLKQLIEASTEDEQAGDNDQHPTVEESTDGELQNLFDRNFDLILIAQSIPDQFPKARIEYLQARHPLTPVVALLGSWCEGDARTGRPIPGVRRIYWHQWYGRFELFRHQLQHDGYSEWHSPFTASVGDQVLRHDPPQSVLEMHSRMVGISATNAIQFQAIQEAIEQLGYRCCWIETADAPPTPGVVYQPICLDTDGINRETILRVEWLHQRFPAAEIIVIASFPRVDQIETLTTLGIRKIVSKPYRLTDLGYAIERCVSPARR